MRRESTLLGVLLIGLLTTMCFGEILRQDETNDVLTRHVDAPELEDLPTILAFSHALLQTRTPAGIVRTLGCEREPAIQKPQPSGSSLRDVLNELVKTDPQYRWIVEDRVINALPVAGDPPLLQTHITEFRIDNAISASSAMYELMATREVRDAMTKLGFEEPLIAGVFHPHPETLGHPVHCKNVTLREALNEIARTFGNAVWYYKDDRCNGTHQYFLDFLTE